MPSHRHHLSLLLLRAVVNFLVRIVNHLLEFFTEPLFLILLSNTLDGIMNASPGDWIIRGIKGEYYPCKEDIFQATYMRVEESEEKQYIVTESKLNNLVEKAQQLESCANPVNFSDDRKEFDKAYWDCRAVELK